MSATTTVRGSLKDTGEPSVSREETGRYSTAKRVDGWCQYFEGGDGYRFGVCQRWSRRPSRVGLPLPIVPPQPLARLTLREVQVVVATQVSLGFA